MDFIDSFSLKTAAPLIKYEILHLVNLSITSSKFAQIWKHQLVLPLHKKKDKLDGNNYRPVSHIIEVSKIVEYAVFDQVYSHCEDNNIFHKNQHGFIGDHSFHWHCSHPAIQYVAGISLDEEASCGSSN